MRTIKFRAWDKENNCWYKPTHEAYKGNLWELLLGFGGGLSAHTIKDGIGELVHESVFPDRYVINQFTGLTDKDGKEIYEGDIVSCNWGINNQYNPAKLKINKDYINTANPLLQIKEVEFCELIGGFAIAFDWEIAKDRHKDILHLTRYRASIFIKVIGNIYENLELLNN